MSPKAIDWPISSLQVVECGSFDRPLSPELAPDQRWFVVHIGPQYDALVLHWFRFLGFESYQFTRLERVAKRKPTRKPVFPGYLFVRFDPLSDRWKLIPQVPGVIRILSEGGAQTHPLALPDGLMEEMIISHRNIEVPEELTVQPISTGPKTGQNVKIKTGPFRSFSAIVEWSDEKVVQTMVTIFGRVSSVAFNRADVAW